MLTTCILIWWLLTNISVVDLKIVSVAREEAANYRSTYGSPIPLKVRLWNHWTQCNFTIEVIQTGSTVFLKVADVTPFMFLSFWLVYIHQCIVFPNITINITPLLTMACTTFMWYIFVLNISPFIVFFLFTSIIKLIFSCCFLILLVTLNCTEWVFLLCTQ